MKTPEKNGNDLQPTSRSGWKDILGKIASHGKITDFSVVTLRTSGMRHLTEYEILKTEDGAEVSEYGLRFADGSETRVLHARAVCSAEKTLALLNRCRLLSWDGFYGKHPRGVLDGTIFSLRATVNGSREIAARGSQNFPRHYRDFTDGLYDMLHGDKYRP